MEHQCRNCNIVYLGRKNKIYCSPRCRGVYHKHKQSGHYAVCDYCGKHFPLTVNQRNSGQRFCDNECKYSWQEKEYAEGRGGAYIIAIKRKEANNG